MLYSRTTVLQNFALTYPVTMAKAHTMPKYSRICTDSANIAVKTVARAHVRIVLKLRVITRAKHEQKIRKMHHPLKIGRERERAAKLTKTS